jgi:mannose-6-phosphate isomerase-like protein (cupin superfamily)
MKHVQVGFTEEFSVIAGNARSQAAVMVLAVGDSTGGPENRHRDSDQWLYVVGGEGSATIGDQLHVLRPGTLVLIERGETHEIRNEGDEPLRTLNFYVPPAYSAEGETLPGGRSGARGERA